MIKKMLNIQRLLFSGGIYNIHKSDEVKLVKQRRSYQIISSLTLVIIMFIITVSSNNFAFIFAYPIIILLISFENTKKHLILVPIVKKDIIINLAFSYLVISILELLMLIVFFPVLDIIVSSFTIPFDYGSIQYSIIEILKSIDLIILSMLNFYCIFMIYIFFSFIKNYVFKIAAPIIFTTLLIVADNYLRKIIPFVPKYEFEDPSVLDRLLRLYNDGVVLTIGLFCTVIIVSVCCFVLMKKRNLFAC